MFGFGCSQYPGSDEQLLNSPHRCLIEWENSNAEPVLSDPHGERLRLKVDVTEPNVPQCIFACNVALNSFRNQFSHSRISPNHSSHSSQFKPVALTLFLRPRTT